MDRSTPGGSWPNWDLPQWNQALFDHFFRTRGDQSPVRRLLATPGELKRVTEDQDAAPSEVLKQFATVVRERLRGNKRSLCTDAAAIPWEREDPSNAGRPPFFAHLMLTCVAASVTGKGGRPLKDFRRRLNRLLGRGSAGDCRYPLARLPQLWEQLRDWLAELHRRNPDYRELILPDPGHRKLIGYSYWLAFPPHRDRMLLSKILARQVEELPVDVGRMLSVLDRHRSVFTRAFRRELNEFATAYSRREVPDLERRPFWTAVLDSLPLPSGPRTDFTSAGHIVLRLDLDSDRHFVLTVLADRPGVTGLGTFVPVAEEFAAEGARYYLANSAHEDESSPAHILLGWNSDLDLSSFHAPRLFRSIRGGVLLFTLTESGFWGSTYTCPQNGENVRALVREAVTARFAAALRDAGVRPIITSSLYPAWSEVRGFQGRHVMATASRGLAGVSLPCHRGTRVRSLTLRDGVRLNGGWLGQHGCLPTVVAPQGKVVVCGPNAAAESSLDLVPTDEDSHLWSFPEKDWQGLCVLRVEEGSRVVARRRVMFSLRADGHQFRPVLCPDRWFQEAGTSDTESAAKDLLGSINTTCEKAIVQPVMEPVEGRQAVPVAALIEVFSGLACRRRGIEELEVYGWIGRLLGVKGKLLRDVARAWVEQGCFDRLSSYRWRRNVYFARPPRLLAVEGDDGSIEKITIEGLLPDVTRERIESAVRILGGRLRCQGTSPWVPATWAVELPTADGLTGVTQRAGLRSPRRLRPEQIALLSVTTMTAKSSELKRNHSPEGIWDWASGHFRRDKRTNLGVEVERYRRKDVPDAFVVWQDGSIVWHGRSATWALLVAGRIRGERAFLADAEVRLRRAPGIGLYLPLPAGRLAALVGNEPPGPAETPGGYDYVYQFGSSQTRNRVLHLLWPIRLSADLLRRAQWLSACVRSRPAELEVPTPQTVRATLQSYESVPVIAELASYRGVPRRLLPHLLALVSSLQKGTGNTSRLP